MSFILKLTSGLLHIVYRKYVNVQKLIKSSSYLLKMRLLVEVLYVKSRQQTGERCGGVFPAPVRSPCQRRCSSPAQHRAAAGSSSRTQRQDQRRGEGGGFMDLKRVYLICDQPAYIKDPVPHRAKHTALLLLTEQSGINSGVSFQWFIMGR